MVPLYGTWCSRLVEISKKKMGHKIEKLNKKKELTLLKSAPQKAFDWGRIQRQRVFIGLDNCAFLNRDFIWLDNCAFLGKMFFK